MDDWGDMEDMEDSDDDESSEGDVLDGWGESEEESDYDESDDDKEVEDEIVEKIMRTFHNGTYDAEFNNALSSNRALTPTIMPTQASYIKPDNWRERNRDGLEGVKEQLQDCIRSAMRDRSFDLCLNHNDGDHPIVWHESILDQYWDQLNAENVKYFCNIQFVNVEITKERLAALVAILSSGRATNSSMHVVLNNANLCAEGIISLAKLVEVSLELEYFDLHHNRIESMDSARCLSRSLKSHTCINEIDLAHCDLGSNPDILLIILQSDVTKIILNNNNINSLGAVKIAEYLDVNPPIEHLFLNHNRLNDDDVILISQALKRNTKLRSIRLHVNNFTSIGVKALLTCVFDGSSLNAISESNHSLHSLSLFSSEEGYKLQCCIERMLCINRTEKILLALQDTDSLLKYLANVTVELIPEVLAFPHGWIDDECQHGYLNIVYSTMRWWNMPMLYSYHQCAMTDAKRKRVD
jgi:hypothetical protein